MQIKKQHDSRVTVEVDGVDLGVWDQMSRPDVGAETGTYRPGGSRHAVATRGLPTLATITVTKVVTREARDRIHRQLHRKVGQVPMRIVDQPLDLNSGTPWGDPDIYTGILSQLSASDYDSDGNDNETVTLTLQPDTSIG